MKSLLVLLTVALLFAGTVQAEEIIQSWSDQTFANSDWSIHVSQSSLDSTPTVSASQSPTGGNPGAYRSVSHLTNVAGSQQLYVVHLHSSWTWNPSTQGPITEVTYSMDANVFNGGISDAVGFGIAIRQASTFYVADYFGIIEQTGWQSHSVTTPLTESDFGLAEWPTPAGNPDFSTSGGLIEFGFLTQNGTSSTTDVLSSSSGVDNVSIEITAIPEPASWLALAAAPLLLRRRR